MLLRALLCLWLLAAAPAFGDVTISGGQAGGPPPTTTVGGLGTCDNSTQGSRRTVTDAANATTCSSGGASTRNVCRCDDGVWGLEGAGTVDPGDKGDITVGGSWEIDASAVGAAEIADGSVGAAEVAADSLGAGDLAADSVSASELNATGVEAELEAVLDLTELQGQVVAADVADNACTEPKLDVIDSPADGELLAFDTGTSRLEWVPPGGILDGDKGDITASGGGATWNIDADTITSTEIAANAVALTSETTGNYAAGDAEAGAALSGDSATAFFSTGTLEDARLSGESESEEVQGGGSSLAASGATVVTDWKDGIHSALAAYLDFANLYKLDFSPTDQGPNAFRLVSTVYTSGTLPTCNAAALGTVEFITDTTCAGPPDYSGICQCQVTDPGDDAGGGSTPSFGWREMYPTPSVWRSRSSGGGTGYVAAVGAGIQHLPSWRVDLFEDTAGACVQMEYLAGGTATGWPVWGRVGITEQMLVALGYATFGDADPVRAFWGWTRAPSGVVINPGAAGATSSFQNFTDGWGYVYWGGTNQLYAGSRRASTSNIFSMGSAFDLSNATNRQFWLSGHMKGMVTTNTLAEFITPGAGSNQWSARFQAKLGFPFQMALHPGGAAPLGMDWTSVTQTTVAPATASSVGQELKPVVALCERSGASGDAQMFFHKASLAAAVYDYD